MSGGHRASRFQATPMPFAMDGGTPTTKMPTASTVVPTSGAINIQGLKTRNPAPLATVSDELPAWFAKTVGNPNGGGAGGTGTSGGGGGGGGTSGGGTGGKDVAPELSPRGKHKYPPMTPWSCTAIAAWVGMIGAFFAIVLIIIFQLPGKHHHHDDNDGDGDMDQRRNGYRASLEHENHVPFRFEAETGPTRWPKTGVIAGLTLEDIVSARLCCVVGTQQYLVCDSSQALTSNLGIAFVVRNIPEENGSHLLITAPSADMTGSQCIFSWQTRLHQHDKASLVVAKAPPLPPSPAGSRFSHAHAGRRQQK